MATVNELYAARINKILELLGVMQVAASGLDPADQTVNWGHVGDLGHVIDQLSNAAQFLSPDTAAP